MIKSEGDCIYVIIDTTLLSNRFIKFVKHGIKATEQYLLYNITLQVFMLIY